MAPGTNRSTRHKDRAADFYQINSLETWLASQEVEPVRERARKFGGVK